MLQPGNVSVRWVKKEVEATVVDGEIRSGERWPVLK